MPTQSKSPRLNLIGQGVGIASQVPGVPEQPSGQSSSEGQ